jgi:hypothetical protein
LSSKSSLARTVLLSNGYLLATWENYSPEPPQVYWPIYQSTNGGLSWAQISEVTDTHNNWGNRYQPFLYVMPQAIGSYPAGTILIAGNSIPSDLSKTLIVIYASKDGGHTWSYVSSVAAGGAANTTDGQTPVWEPFLLTYNNQIVCYYSDQRDSSYAQKLVYQTSSDLKTWSGVTNVVAVSPYTARHSRREIRPDLRVRWGSRRFWLWFPGLLSHQLQPFDIGFCNRI